MELAPRFIARRFTLAALACMCLVIACTPRIAAAVTSIVVEIPTRGVKQPILYARPDAPVATIVYLPGASGSLAALPETCDVVTRNRDAFAALGFAVAVVDVTSDGFVRRYEDIREVVRYVRSRDNVPTWLIGGSASTQATWDFAVELPLDEPMGVVFQAPVGINASGLQKRPTLIVSHNLDPVAKPAQLFAALTAAPAKELVTLSGGSGLGGCFGFPGYHVFAGIDAEFVGAVANFIKKYNPTLAPLPGGLDLNQHGLTGSWYEPATSGQGFEVEVFPDLSGPGTGLVFVSWFTYDTVVGAAARQRWYTLSGLVVTGQPTASLTIYQNVGGNFNALPVTTSQQVGTATLTFDTCASGQLSYSFTDGTGRTGHIPLTRLTQNVTCSTSSARPTNPDFALSGNWFDPATSGQGLTVEVNPTSSTIFAAWYTYAPNSASAGAAGQRWFTAQPTTTGPGARSFPVTIRETTGGSFDAPTPPGQQTVPVGTGTLAFQSCSNATLSYNFTGGSSSGASGVINLTRVGRVPPGCIN